LLIKQEAWRAWEDRSESALVRSRVLETALAVEDRLMKLTGATEPAQAAQPLNVFMQHIPDEMLGSREYRDAVSGLLAVLPPDLSRPPLG
jgi:hypothetical protein